MKNFVKDLLYGVLLIAIVLMLEFVVTLPFSEMASESDPQRWSYLINRELLLAAVPAALAAFLLTALLKPKTRFFAFIKSVIWTAMVAVFYILIGYLNGTFSMMFGGIGIYALLLGVAIGPICYAVIKKLK